MSAESIEKIERLLEIMKEHDLVEFELEEQDFRVKFKKPGAQIVVPSAGAPAPAPSQYAAGGGSAPAPVPAGGERSVEDEGDLVPIKSPIVGTFYRAPAPDADPFVKEGDAVDQDTIVCIVEAMKIMNEIKAEVKGTIERILVENGEAVEYGTPLFLVRPR